ncbi:MAG: glycosyl transferase [Prevotella sp.]|nr:glycosyl transferase [Prevotella sp.]
MTKTIHYCWFGRNPLPASAKKCIESWRRHFPGYEVREWNEDNFDVNIIPYTRDAYAAGKYAFVSDYARFWILYHHGGLYFDTDVEVIRPMYDLIANGSFMGFEKDDVKHAEKAPVIAPGLGLYAELGNSVYAEILSHFEQMSFYLPDGTFNSYTMIPMVTELFQEKGLVLRDEQQTVAGITIYPNDYFNPFDDITGVLRKTPNTRSIHWYAKSWIDNNKPWLVHFKRLVRRVIGTGYLYETIKSTIKSSKNG